MRELNPDIRPVLRGFRMDTRIAFLVYCDDMKR
jgi:hypothetical protein